MTSPRAPRLIAPVDWSSTEPDALPTVAVLPLAELSPEPRDDYFADGLTEMLINELAKIRALRVISATSVRRYRETEESVPEIAAALGADYIVEGTVTRDGNQVRTTAQLIEATSDTHLWAQSYVRRLAGSLALQAEIARRVADQVGGVPAHDEAMQPAPLATVEPAALEAYLRGRHLYGQRTAEDVAAAIRAFEETVRFEPRPGPRPVKAEHWDEMEKGWGQGS